MSVTIADGGPAFPNGPGGGSFTGPDGYTTHQFQGSEGMSLRDYFAIHANQPGQAEICNLLGWTCDGVNRNVPFHERPSDFKCVNFSELWNVLTLEEQCAAWAKVRYAMADAMLSARA